jgi:hypothetical protein
MRLRIHLLLRLDAKTLALFGEQPAGEAFLLQLMPGALLILINRQRLLELRLHLERGLQILLGLVERGLLRFDRIALGLAV